jgi:hypothetical protein
MQGSQRIAIEMAMAVSNLYLAGTAASRYASCRMRNSPPVTLGLNFLSSANNPASLLVDWSMNMSSFFLLE